MFLLPVPASPIVCQLSSIRPSAHGIRKKPGLGGPALSGGGIMPPRKNHCALSQPLAKLHDPEMR